MPTELQPRVRGPHESSCDRDTVTIRNCSPPPHRSPLVLRLLISRPPEQFANAWRKAYGKSMSNSPVRNARLFIGVLGLGMVLTTATSTRGADGTYHFLKEIPVGGEGGWDYLSVDAAARRLYVPHRSHVVVIDLDKEEVVGEVTDTPGVHGFALAPDLERGFASNGQE